ncbi:MAG: SHOCT domain-containing protein [Actinobacteria bacterium]|nr:SHOCT domain-containing protein [Actinomycetota bacterium]
MSAELGVPAFFAIMAAFFPLLFLATLGLIIFMAVRNYNKAKSMGKDPFTLQTEVIAKLADSKLLQGEESIEQKLAEADELLAKGSITQTEHSELRKTILKEF